jgi:hypothetical protein
MAYREFDDDNGRRWVAWDTYPESETLSRVRPDYARGWLSFECGAERRRHVPVPDAWETLPASTLCTLLDRSTLVTRARRDTSTTA